jgi:hypothetical protein
MSTSGTNIYNSDGSLTGDRTMTMGNNVLDLTGSGTGIMFNNAADVLQLTAETGILLITDGFISIGDRPTNNDTTTVKPLVYNTSSNHIEKSNWVYAGSGSGSGMAIGNAITSATNGSVLYAGTNGVLRQSNTTFFFDSTNNRLGINNGAPASRLHVNFNQNSVTQSDVNGIYLANSTAAISGTQSISPPFVWQGNGFSTTGSVSIPVEFRADVLPVQGTTATATWQLASSINNGAYTNRLTVSSAGTVSMASGNTTIDVNGGLSTVLVGATTGMFNGAGATMPTYRTTNGGGNVTPTDFFGLPVSATAGDKGWAFDATNHLSLTAANGTRQIARGSIQILSLTNTAGSETGDLAFFTKPSGAAITERLRITATGNLTIGTAGATVSFPGATSGTALIQATAIAGTPTLTLPTVTGTIVQYAEASITSSSTPTPTGDARQNFLYITALAADPTFAAPSGTPANGNMITIRIKDNSTVRALAWNAIYRGGVDIALPTTTQDDLTMYLQFIYNSADSKWDLVGKTDGL